jgi:hypothetical protein
MYAEQNSAQAGAAGGTGGGGGGSGGSGEKADDGNVVDAEFEEIKDGKK